MPAMFGAAEKPLFSLNQAALLMGGCCWAAARASTLRPGYVGALCGVREVTTASNTKLRRISVNDDAKRVSRCCLRPLPN